MIRVALIVATFTAHFARLAQADALVDFSNHRDFHIPADRLVRQSDGAPLVGTNYFAQLYYGSLDAEPSSLTPVTSSPARFRAPTHALPGTWTPGAGRLRDYDPGQTVTLQVRVWDGTIADSYEEAAAISFLGTQHGVSAPFDFPIPSASAPAEAFYIENFRGFTLVPEPSLALLAMVGMVGLYFTRRRKE